MSIEESNQKVIIVGGPTGTGKTGTAIQIAMKYNGELVNCDSRQIYKYLDIGTNKGKLELADNTYTINSIPIHLINLIEPNERFDLFRFQQLAFEKIEDILKRGKLPILVGGTGLYIDSILKNYELSENGAENREYLESLKKEELQKLVLEQSNNKAPMNDSDWNNPRRLIRFIEKSKSKKRKPNTNSYKFTFIYPEYNWEDLLKNIDRRVEAMFEEGLVEETQSLLEKGYTENDPGLNVMGYREVVQLINNEINKNKCIELVQNAHRQYAKRQKTWFEGGGRNYDLKRYKNIDDALKLVN